MNFDRRQILKGGTALALGAALPGLATTAQAATTTATTTLTAKPGTAQIGSIDKPLTLPFWGYDGATPGRVLRLDQGSMLDIGLRNELAEETSIHWHGIRTPNAMDGVPHLTQPPVGVGADFNYRFRADDAGTFWYHPHANSAEQIGRGLYGALIVDEQHPVPVDRDLVWMLGDWVLGQDGKFSEDFTSMGQNSHGGRIGNLATVNGQHLPLVDVQPGERLRLRLVNAAGARVFSFDFSGLSGWWVALDGQPITPRPIDKEPVFIAPGNRADVVLDIPMGATADQVFEVIDATYRNRRFAVASFRAQGKPVRGKVLAMPEKMADNPLAKPNLDGAELKNIIFEGGAMGRMQGAKLDGADMGMRDLVNEGVVWATNGQAWSSLEQIAKQAKLLKLDHGKTYVFRLQNRTAFHHPIHMHGHTFQVIAENGKKLDDPEWRDTVLVFPNEHVDIAFVADNPGDWMFHCHILEHMAGGMMAVVRVT